MWKRCRSCGGEGQHGHCTVFGLIVMQREFYCSFKCLTGTRKFFVDSTLTIHSCCWHLYLPSQDDWQRQKRSLMPASGLGLAFPRGRAADGSATAAEPHGREGLSTGLRQGRQVAGSEWLESGGRNAQQQQQQQQQQKEQAYAVAVSQLNAALESGRSAHEVRGRERRGREEEESLLRREEGSFV